MEAYAGKLGRRNRPASPQVSGWQYDTGLRNLHERASEQLQKKIINRHTDAEMS